MLEWFLDRGAVVTKSDTDYVVMYWVFLDDGSSFGTNSWKTAKENADKIGGYVVAQGQSGWKRKVYDTRVIKVAEDV